MSTIDDLERVLALAHRRLDRRDAGLDPALPGDPVPLWRVERLRTMKEAA